jgi:TolA-binding protein
MEYRKIFLGGLILFLMLASVGEAEDFALQHFLSKASSKTIELSKKEKTALLNQLEDVIKQAQEIRAKLIQTLQTGETDVRYQEGKFWMSKLEDDKESIETGIQQIKLLKERPSRLVASIKLYKSLKDLSQNFNAYNNMSSFSAFVGDLAPEMELWADPVFYKLHLLPLARIKDPEVKVPPREKKPEATGKKP